MPTLEGVRVLDLTRALAGPFCTQMLGDHGADVIKIEIPGVGDDTRQWGPAFVGTESSYYLSINRNKRSLTLNLKERQAKEIFLKLAEDADVVVETLPQASWGDLVSDTKPSKRLTRESYTAPFLGSARTDLTRTAPPTTRSCKAWAAS